MQFRFFSVLGIFIVVCLNSVVTKCTNEVLGLYCTNIGSNHSQSIILETVKEEKYIFLRNVTGIITKTTFDSFPNLKCLDIRFSSIKNITVNSTSLEELYLIKNHGLPNVSILFEKYPNLTTLFIQDNFGLNITGGAFKYAKHLNHLTINDQHITHLTEGLLQGLSELTYLSLKQNNIEKIDGNAFENLINLNYLKLSDNNITVFENNTFQNLKILESIEIFNLNITSLNKTTFKNQRQLRYLGVPTKLIKEKLTINNLTEIFSNLETIGIKQEDQSDIDVQSFMKTCKKGGFNLILI